MYTGRMVFRLAWNGPSGAKSRHGKIPRDEDERCVVIKVPAEICPICDGTGWKTVPAGPHGFELHTERRENPRDRQPRAPGQPVLFAARIPRRAVQRQIGICTARGARAT